MSAFSNVAQPGADTLGSDTQRDLFLKKFSGETLASFNTKTVIKEHLRIRNVSGQKSAQFPAIGRAAAQYHQPGEEIDGQAINHGEVTINIDDLLISPVFVSNFLEAMRHFETRGEYARQMGDSLAQAYDQKAFAKATKACLTGATGPVSEMGAATKADLGTTPTIAAIIDAIYDGQRIMDERDIPENDRVLFVTPQVYYDLVSDGRVLNRDYGNADAGSQSSASVLKVAGLSLIKTNNLDKNWANGQANDLNVEREGSVLTEYEADGSSNLFLLMQRQAIGAVHLMDISTESEYSVRHQGDLMVSRMANGMGVLRPECLHMGRSAA